jgi:protease-4
MTVDLNNINMSSPITVLQAVAAIEYAETDDNIMGICIYQNGMGTVSATNIEELRQAIIRFKRSGKFVVAYDDNYTQSEYYLASVADRISMHPEGGIEWRGMAFNVMFFKGLMDKLNVDVEIFRPTECKYKSAVEPYFLTQMSEANRKQMESLAESMWTSIVNDVAQERGISPEQLKTIANDLKVNNADQAKEYKFVDAIEYEDDLINYLKESGVKLSRQGELNKISLGTYAQNVAMMNPTLNTPSKRSVAIIYADGQIVDGNMVSNGYIYGNTLATLIREARNNDKIKAVVVRVNSPGGSALASDIIWREMLLLQQKKPVVISMGEYAASGGYYISAPADYIIADKLTLTGSIGVFGMIPNVERMLKNELGITVDMAATSPSANGMTLVKPMTERQKEVLLQSIDNTYTTFTSKVAEGRNLTIEQVYNIAEGRVWSGKQAVSNGLVDANGTFHDAIIKAADMADLGDDFTIYEIKTPMTPFEAWLDAMGMMTAKACGIDYNIYGEELKDIIKKNADIFTNNGILMAMPQNIEVNF